MEQGEYRSVIVNYACGVCIYKIGKTCHETYFYHVHGKIAYPYSAVKRTFMPFTAK